MNQGIWREYMPRSIAIEVLMLFEYFSKKVLVLLVAILFYASIGIGIGISFKELG